MDKVKAYRLGSYRFPPPPGPTFGWNEEAWIKYIDLHGQWTLQQWTITYDDGFTLSTSIASDVEPDEVLAYFLTGQPVEITETTFRTAVKAERVR